MSRIEGSNTLLEGEEAFTNVCVSPILEEPAPVTNGQAITISTSLYYCSENLQFFENFWKFLNINWLASSIRFYTNIFESHLIAPRSQLINCFQHLSVFHHSWKI